MNGFGDSMCMNSSLTLSIIARNKVSNAIFGGSRAEVVNGEVGSLDRGEESHKVT